MPTVINTDRVEVNSTTTPVLIVAARVGRTGLKVFVQAQQNTFLTVGGTNAVTPADGYPIPIGEYKFDPVVEGDVYGLGTGLIVGYMETY